MRLFLFATTFILTLVTVTLIWTSTVMAAEPVTILGASQNMTAPQLVSVAQSGIELRYFVKPQSPTEICWPVSQTVTPATVKIHSSTDDRDHPFHAVSWSETSETITFNSNSVTQYRFKLSAPQVGYELRPYTAYSLALEGGAGGIRFSCKQGSGAATYHYLPESGYSLSFNTGADTVAPIITEHSLLNTSNNAVLGWITSETAKTQVSYGTSTAYGTTKSVPGTHEKHFLELKNLQPGTTYYYKLQSKDADGSGTATRLGTFKTWSISPITISDTTGHEASIKWITNPATDSIIEYGTSPDMGQVSGKHGVATNHDVRLVHLKSNQIYYGRIQLVNGDAVSVSDIFSFKTLDAGAGVSSEVITVTPQFSSEFDLTNFNFRDFPLETYNALSNQASSGAVLAAEDKDLYSIAGNFGSIVEQHKWAIWLWVPVLLLIFLIAGVWLLHRHQHTANTVEQELAKHKLQNREPVTPPKIS